MTVSESARVQRAIKWLRSQGHYATKIHGGGFSRSGVPDVLCCVRPSGKFAAFEFKTEEGRVSDYQKREIRLIQNAGGIAHVVTSLEEVKSIVERINAGI